MAEARADPAAPATFVATALAIARIDNVPALVKTTVASPEPAVAFCEIPLLTEALAAASVKVALAFAVAISDSTPVDALVSVTNASPPTPANVFALALCRIAVSLNVALADAPAPVAFAVAARLRVELLVRSTVALPPLEVALCDIADDTVAVADA